MTLPLHVGDFVLVRNLNSNRLQLLFTGEPKDEEKAFMKLEKLIKKSSKTKDRNCLS